MNARRSKSGPRPKTPREATGPLDLRRFVLRVLLFLLPVIAVWLIALPLYNRFLTVSTENLVRLFEHPAATRLATRGIHHFMISHDEVGHVGSVRVTDVHFPWLMLAAFFLAVPGVPLRRRLGDLGWASLATVFFHWLSLLFWVKFFYATQLGDWSAAHYGAVRANFWGLGKHLLDLPFKFAWPLGLWCAFYLRLLLPAPSRTR